MKNRIIRLPEVMAKTGLSRSSVYLAISKGTFPAQIKLGDRSTGWSLDQVDNWIEQCIASGGASRGEKL